MTFPPNESFNMLAWLLMPEVTDKKTDKTHFASVEFKAELCPRSNFVYYTNSFLPA